MAATPSWEEHNLTVPSIVTEAEQSTETTSEDPALERGMAFGELLCLVSAP